MDNGNTDLPTQSIERVLDIFRAYKNKQQTQKMRGLNDFNVFTVLLSESDEVRLHSRFLHSLLDPHGTHGQLNLFLDLFLGEIRLSDMDIDTRACSVYKEYRNIDLYITDGSKHIIIENKIYATDQDKQIERYIDIIKSENKDDNDFSQNLTVVYLSLDRTQPSKPSLGSFEYKNERLTKNDENYRLLVITYNNEILRWIKASEEQVANITNLSVVLKQYEEVILKLYNRYKGKLMSLKTFVEGQGYSLGTLKRIWEIKEEYPALREDMANEFFGHVKKYLMDGLPDDWKLEIKEDAMGSKYGQPLSLQHSTNSEILFCFEFEKNDYVDAYYGVTRKGGEAGLKKLRNNPQIKALLDKVVSPLPNNSDWWLSWDWYCQGDLFKRILDDGGAEQAASKFSKLFLTGFNHYKEVIMKCDDIIGTN